MLFGIIDFKERACDRQTGTQNEMHGKGSASKYCAVLDKIYVVRPNSI